MKNTAGVNQGMHLNNCKLGKNIINFAKLSYFNS